MYITIIVVFLTVFSTRVSLLSSKIQNEDDTAKESISCTLDACVLCKSNRLASRRTDACHLTDGEARSSEI